MLSDISDLSNELATTKVKVADIETAMNDTTLRVSDIEKKVIPKMVVEYHKLVQDLTEKLIFQEIHDCKLNLLIEVMVTTQSGDRRISSLLGRCWN